MEINANDFRPDPLALHEDWAEQSNLCWRYGEHVAECVRAHDESKARLDVVKTKCYAMLKGNPAKYGMAKATDKAIDLKIPDMAIYRDAQQEVIDARYELELAKAALRAVETKRRALEELVELHFSNYYSEPTTDIRAEQGTRDERRAIVDRRQRRRNSEEDE